MQDYLSQEIKYLKGVGPKRAELLEKELNILSFSDLLNHFPYKYIDKSRIYTIVELRDANAFVQIKGRITGFSTEGSKYKPRLIARFEDHTGGIELIWYQGIKWLKENLKVGIEYLVFGKPAFFNRRLNIAHPEMEEFSRIDPENRKMLSPQYSTTEKLKSSYLNSKTLQTMLDNMFASKGFHITEFLPAPIIKKYNLLPASKAYRTIHGPNSVEELKRAEYRLKFEELLLIQLKILKSKQSRTRIFDGFVFEKIGDNFNNFFNQNLKFELTGAQKRVLKEIRRDLKSSRQMNRLLQGDVGSGKTLVALMSMLIALDNGYQACLMAPTEILATQHYKTISKFLEGLEINVSLLKGSTRKKAREQIHEELLSGRLQILIGTHALLEDPVVFGNLGLVVIDEQHRFGVAQRAKLWRKNTQPPHMLVMTATPIPRTLAMTLYGDLDVSVIDELPPGRKPIKTFLQSDNQRLKLFGFLRQQINEGRQVYIVYPLIKESEKLDFKDLEDGYMGITEVFPPPEYTVVCVHGKMKAAEKEASMKRFSEGKAQILVATTVIEVGVDVPNATVMVIESAERFGLSQLHQLRGRVGRGGNQSYCVLMASYKLSNEGRKRLQTMVATNDGFEIAEADLQLRGPGDLEGTQQSGIPFDLKIANLAKDGQLLQMARNIAEEILEEDPNLSKPENLPLNKKLKQLRSSATDWSVIS